LDIISRTARLFDEVVVAVIRNPEKEPRYSLEQRVSMIEKSVSSLPNVTVESFAGLLVDYTKQKQARVIIRGLRAVSDFDYEFQMALTNRKMAPEIETLFLMTDYKYSYLSSSFVKQIAYFGGDISEMVPPVVVEKLKKGEG